MFPVFLSVITTRHTTKIRIYPLQMLYIFIIFELLFYLHISKYSVGVTTGIFEVTWHSPQLKQGDSCFFHHCIDEYLTVLQCLTQCPQAMFILFPYALRYSFSSLCRLHLQCFFQNINACIRIPVMNCMAFRALPDTNAQIFYPWISVAARTAGLTARIHRWYSVKFISIPDSFIFQHFEKLCPGNTCYGFCQFMVPDHSLHVQILDTDGLVFAHQHRWLFLQEIIPLIGYFLMHSGYPEPLLPAVMGIFLLPGKSALFSYEFSHGAFQISGIWYRISIAVRIECFDSNINSNRSSSIWAWFRFEINI